MSTILESSVASTSTTEETTNLIRENYLSEFETEDEKSVVRSNLGVYGQEATYTQEEAQLMVSEKIAKALEDYVTNGALEAAENVTKEQILAEDFVKSDGSIPFTNPQSQSSLPTSDEHLTNKLYVDNSLTSHVNASDPHGTLAKVETTLAGYAKLSDTYTTKKTYSKKEVDTLLSGYLKRDGSTVLTAPQPGADPTLPSHLATSRFVNLVMQNHKTETDPHDMLATIKRYLSNYYTKSETYTKAQTYSRTQLLDIVKSQMKDVVDQAIAQYEANSGSISDLREWVKNQLYNYVKADDGTFTTHNEDGGVATLSLSALATKEDLENEVATLADSVSDTDTATKWVTSGPVEKTVGFVEEGTELPATMTLQQICDAIFYGQMTGIEAPEYASYGDTICVKIYSHGLSTIESVDIYKDGTIVATIYPDDFSCGDDGCYYEYCDSEAITSDQEWSAEFHYADGSTVTDSTTVTVAYPIYIGTIPYWWNTEEDVTFDRLRELVKNDPDNCKFYTDLGPDISEVTMAFNFEDAEKRNIIVVIPCDYKKKLAKMVTPTQDLEAEAFLCTTLPLYPVDDLTSGICYKIYMYKQALVKLDQEVTFYFEVEE